MGPLSPYLHFKRSLRHSLFPSALAIEDLNPLPYSKDPHRELTIMTGNSSERIFVCLLSTTTDSSERNTPQATTLIGRFLRRGLAIVLEPVRDLKTRFLKNGQTAFQPGSYDAVNAEQITCSFRRTPLLSLKRIAAMWLSRPGRTMWLIKMPLVIKIIVNWYCPPESMIRMSMATGLPSRLTDAIRSFRPTPVPLSKCITAMRLSRPGRAIWLLNRHDDERTDDSCHPLTVLAQVAAGPLCIITRNSCCPQHPSRRGAHARRAQRQRCF